jgi:hypothetical protein
LEPAYLDDRICAIGVVRVTSQKPVLDALFDGAAKVGCNISVEKVFLELSDNLVALSCTGLAEVLVRHVVVSDWVHCGQISAVAPQRLSRTPTGNQPSLRLITTVRTLSVSKEMLIGK